MQDMLIAYVDGLKGSPEAIAAIFPKTEVQTCVIHQTGTAFAKLLKETRKFLWLT